MANNKPSDSQNKIVSYDIFINNKIIDEKFHIHKVITRKKVNKISRATIYIYGGDTDNNSFSESDESIFNNGNEIEIKLGYEQSNTTVFKGLIDSHGISLDSGYQNSHSRSLLVLECVDKSIKLVNSYTNEIYEDSRESDIFKKILQKVDGLNFSVDQTESVYPVFPKYNNSDWDFIVQRSKANGLLVFNSNNNIKIIEPSFSNSSQLTVSNNGSTVSFHAQQKSSNQFNNLTINSIESFQNNKLSTNSKETNSKLLASDNFNKNMIYSTTPDTIEFNFAHDLINSDIQSIANSHLSFSRLNRVFGKVKFRGCPSIDLNSIVSLVGFGNKFSTDVYVTEVIHELNRGIILTEIGFGLKDDYVTQNNNKSFNKHHNINQITGLHIGQITEISGDPQNQYRVKVIIPQLSEIGNSIWEGISDQGIWAKLSHSYTSEDSGFYFIPDIGTQVIVSFLANDPKQPVVLGCLNTIDNIPYKTMEDGNDYKAIVTKNKMMLEFDELKNIMTLSTEKGNKIILNEEDQEITISDENSNYIKTSNSGIEINSQSDISIQAKGSVNIVSQQTTSIDASGDAILKGANIKNEAQVKFSANGSTGSEITSSGSTSIKGSMVQIN